MERIAPSGNAVSGEKLSGPVMSLQMRPACIDCRERHIRCDRAAPVCSNCSKARPPRRCVLERLKIRHSSYSAKARRHQKNSNAAPSQPSQGVTEPSGPAESPSRLQQVTSTTPNHALDTLEPWTPQYHASPAQSLPDQPQSQPTPGGYSNLGEPFGTPQSTRLAGSGSGLSQSSPSSAFCYGRASRSGRVVTDEVERSVFDFYINHAGPWLDIASAQRHFGQTVTRMALTEPVLYAACLAYASHVLFLNGALDRAVHDEFQDRAIGILIPLLSPKAAPAKEDALLATAVILRMSEQFSELADDEQHHLRGSYSLFSTAQEKWPPGMLTLRGVVFWTYVRESIRVSFLNEEPCQFSLDIVDPNFAMAVEEPEEAWTNHMSYLLAKMCLACWGDGDAETKEAMRDEVCAELERWRSSLPDAFQPWHFSRQDFEPFPIVKFLSPWHELAWQQFYTIKVMAAVYGNQRDKNISVLEMHQLIEDEIMSPARMACSICLSTDNVGCNINGAHLISWCGRFFTGKEEQRQLAKFLEDFTANTSWPNRTCYDRLRRIWDGSRKTWVQGNGSFG